jgi:hypothetical protein
MLTLSLLQWEHAPGLLWIQASISVQKKINHQVNLRAPRMGGEIEKSWIMALIPQPAILYIRLEGQQKRSWYVCHGHTDTVQIRK